MFIRFDFGIATEVKYAEIFAYPAEYLESKEIEVWEEKYILIGTQLPIQILSKICVKIEIYHLEIMKALFSIQFFN